MNISKLVKLVIFVQLILIISLFAFNTRAEEEELKRIPLEVDYPDLPGIEAPTSETVTLPRYIVYVYRFAIIAGGLIAFGATLIGGFMFLTSGGNPMRMSDAKNRILMGILGLVIILGSYIVLNELNPSLVSLKPPGLNALGGKYIIAYTDSNCGGGSNGTPGLFYSVPEGTQYVKVTGHMKPIDNFSIGSFWSSDGPPALSQVAFYPNENCEENAIAGGIFTPQANTCNQINMVHGVECIKLTWKIPGVWLFNYENGSPLKPSNDPAHSYIILQRDSANLPKGIEDKVKSIALVPDPKSGLNYGVILRNLPESSRTKKAGWTHLYLPSDDGIVMLNTERADASSAIVFQVDAGAPDSWVKICENTNCDAQKDDEGKGHFAEIIYEWGEMKSISRQPDHLAKKIVINAEKDEWWPGGDKVAVCDETLWWDWLSRANQSIGDCYRGISAIYFEPGARYIAILIPTKSNTLLNMTRQATGPVIIDGSTRNLVGLDSIAETIGEIIIIKTSGT